MLVTEISIFQVVGYITKFLTLYRNRMKMRRFSDVWCSSFGRDDDIEDAGAMRIGFLCSFPLPPHTFFPRFPCSNALRGVGQLSPRGEQWPGGGRCGLTTVSSLGAAPCWSRTLMTWVCPCCAAWCSGVYPFCRHRERERLQRARRKSRLRRASEAELENSPSFWH